MHRVGACARGRVGLQFASSQPEQSIGSSPERHQRVGGAAQFVGPSAVIADVLRHPGDPTCDARLRRLETLAQGRDFRGCFSARGLKDQARRGKHVYMEV